MCSSGLRAQPLSALATNRTPYGLLYASPQLSHSSVFNININIEAFCLRCDTCLYSIFKRRYAAQRRDIFYNKQFKMSNDIRKENHSEKHFCRTISILAILIAETNTFIANSSSSSDGTDGAIRILRL